MRYDVELLEHRWISRKSEKVGLIGNSDQVGNVQGAGHVSIINGEISTDIQPHCTVIS